MHIETHHSISSSYVPGLALRTRATEVSPSPGGDPGLMGEADTHSATSLQWSDVRVQEEPALREGYIGAGARGRTWQQVLNHAIWTEKGTAFQAEGLAHAKTEIQRQK